MKYTMHNKKHPDSKRVKKLMENVHFWAPNDKGLESILLSLCTEIRLEQHLQSVADVKAKVMKMARTNASSR